MDLPGYSFDIGDGDGFKIEIRCTPEQRVCINEWFRKHDLPGLLNALATEKQRVASGEPRPCGCGE